MINKNNKIIVIGAGASGLMAACTAAKNGSKVILLDGNESVGRKINATGNGRCNFTNEDADNIIHYHGGDKRFIESVLSRFDVKHILDFFESIGVEPNLEDEGKYFPLSGQACCVSELLERYAISLGVEIKLNERVINVKTDKNGVEVFTENSTFKAQNLIVACGGAAAPDTGSNGWGYEFAKSLGHTVVNPKAIIVQLKTKNGFYKSLSGLRTKAKVSLICNEKIVREEYGDLMFFDYGLSGPPVFQLSCNAAKLLETGKKVYCKIDLLPQYDFDTLMSKFSVRCKKLQCTAQDLLIGIVNRKLIKFVMQNSGIEPTKLTENFSEKDIKDIVTALKYSTVEVVGTKGWENAQATLGGVALDEVDSLTLRSKLNSRVSFCGEVLDVAGDCGGYNLTWAWASGFVCGKAAAEDML